jgi:hypothetical protein
MKKIYITYSNITRHVYLGERPTSEDSNRQEFGSIEILCSYLGDTKNPKIRELSKRKNLEFEVKGLSEEDIKNINFCLEKSEYKTRIS